MLKKQRQQAILRLVRTLQVHTQEELAERLRATGVEATQVTLSRDIRELGLVKTPKGYQEMGTPAPAIRLEDIVAEFLVEARAAQNLVVLKTTPGSAGPLAVALDSAAWPEIVGTLAGDDTVLVIAPDAGAAEEFRRKVTALA